jgi:hypothetical protein
LKQIVFANIGGSNFLGISKQLLTVVVEVEGSHPCVENIIGILHLMLNMTNFRQMITAVSLYKADIDLKRQWFIDDHDNQTEM